MKSIKLYALLFMVVTFSSCGAGIGDSSEDLGSRYYYLSNGSVNSIEHEDLPFTQELPSRIIDYQFDSSFIIAKQVPVAKHYISSFTWDLMFNYIWSLEKDTSNLPMDRLNQFKTTKWWLDSTIKNRFMPYVREDFVSDLPRIKPIVAEILSKDSLFVKIHSSPLNYWIIDKKSTKVYGPLTYSSFLETKEKIGVTDDLELEK